MLGKHNAESRDKNRSVDLASESVWMVPRGYKYWFWYDITSPEASNLARITQGFGKEEEGWYGVHCSTLWLLG